MFCEKKPSCPPHVDDVLLSSRNLWGFKNLASLCLS